MADRESRWRGLGKERREVEEKERVARGASGRTGNCCMFMEVKAFMFIAAAARSEVKM